MKKQFCFGATLALCLSFCCSVGPAFAFDSSNITEVSELEECIRSGDYCTLGDNIEFSSTITHDSRARSHIDLGGHNIIYTGTGDAFYIKEGNLNITGSGSVIRNTTAPGAAFSLTGTADPTGDEETGIFRFSALSIGENVTISAKNATAIRIDEGEKPYGIRVKLYGSIESATGIHVAYSLPENILPWIVNKTTYSATPTPDIEIASANISASDVAIRAVAPSFIYINSSDDGDRSTISGKNTAIYTENGFINIYDSDLLATDANTIEIASKPLEGNEVDLNIHRGVISTENGAHGIYEYLASGATSSAFLELYMSEVGIFSEEAPILISNECEDNIHAYVSSADLSGRISDKLIYEGSFQDRVNSSDSYVVREYLEEPSTQEDLDRIAERLGGDIFVSWANSLSDEEIENHNLKEKISLNYANFNLYKAYDIGAAIDYASTMTVETIHELPDDYPVYYIFNIPSSMLNSGDPEKQREFHVLRVHGEGKDSILEEVETEIVSNPYGSFSIIIKATRFSDYIVGFSDGELTPVPEAPNSGQFTEQINALSYTLLPALIISGLTSLIFTKKLKKIL